MISYNINADWSVDIFAIAHHFINAVMLIVGFFSARGWKLSHSKKFKPAKNRSLNGAFKPDVGLFFVFVLNRFILLFFLYVFVKTAWNLPIRGQHPEIFQYVALGVGGYMGGILMWIFELSRSLLKDSNS
jgi:hypothetical protein